MSKLMMARWSAGAAVVVAGCLAAASARSREADATEAQAAHVAHLLAYLDADYARSGAAEQREHLALADRAARLARGLEAPSGVARRVADLRDLFAGEPTSNEVHARVGGLASAILAGNHVARAPERAPDFAHGRVLFEAHCATCHGVTGRADTPVAATLRPHPASFRDPLFGDTLSPYDVTTAIRFGVEGTAMNPWPELDASDRWDVAFYVVGLRHGGAIAGDVPPVPREELATLTDAELRERLFARGIGGARLGSALDALRRGGALEASAWPEDAPLLPTSDAPAHPCSEPGFGPGPVLHAGEGLPAFDVTHDCMFPGNARLEIAVNLRKAERPARAEVESLLRTLFDQVRAATTPAVPGLAHVCVFPAGTTDGQGAYGCLAFEGDEGPDGELAVHVEVPFAPAEWVASFAANHSQSFLGALRPHAEPDATWRTIVVTYPFVDGDGNAPARRVTLAEAAIHLFPWLFDFFPAKTDVPGITFVGIWRGRTV
ncbi:MAG TPA: cytochrome c, partial [Polyangiaceae bacterium]